MHDLNERQFGILMALLGTRGPVKLETMKPCLDPSSHEMPDDLLRVETWLQAKGVALTRTPGARVQISLSAAERKSLLQELQCSDGYCPPLSSDQRLCIVLLILLRSDEPLPLKQLWPQLRVSRKTLLADMDRAERWLAERNLRLVRRPHYGFKVAGEERTRREASVQLMLHKLSPVGVLALCDSEGGFLPNTSDTENQWWESLLPYLRPQELRSARKLTDVMAAELGGRFTDSARAYITLHAALAVDAVRRGKSVQLPSDAIDKLKKQAEWRIAEAFARRVGHWLGVAVPESEIAYLVALLQTSELREGASDAESPKGSDGADLNLHDVVDQFLAAACVQLHPYLLVDQQLRHNLTLHIGRFLARLRWGLPVHNPLLNDVREKYPRTFEAARTSCAALEAEAGVVVPDEEIGYLTMHLGAALERLRPPLPAQKRVLLVGASGVEAALLAARVRSKLADVRVVAVTAPTEVASALDSGDVDAVISTLPLGIVEIPSVVVSPLLDSADRSRIRQALVEAEPRVSEHEVTDPSIQASLCDLLTHQTVKVLVPAAHWRRVVLEAGKLLLLIGAVEGRYISAIVNLTTEHGPFMVVAPGVALLHAQPRDGVRQLSMGLITLQSPVEFGHSEYDPVFMAFILGAIDGEAHLFAMQQLARLIRNRQALEAIGSANSADEVLRLVQSQEHTS